MEREYEWIAVRKSYLKSHFKDYVASMPIDENALKYFLSKFDAVYKYSETRGEDENCYGVDLIYKNDLHHPTYRIDFETNEADLWLIWFDDDRPTWYNTSELEILLYMPNSMIKSSHTMCFQLKHALGIDVVDAPDHYVGGRKYEPRKVIEDWDLDYYLGNAVKYISRAGRKNSTIEDLQKAQKYLDFEIEKLSKGE